MSKFCLRVWLHIDLRYKVLPESSARKLLNVCLTRIFLDLCKALHHGLLSNEDWLNGFPAWKQHGHSHNGLYYYSQEEELVDYVKYRVR
ncbi:hypothetical protein Nepgr_018511 [Nepenthes gracilis]|uniref:Uncharacterized protein n=1 Tax=Nepenthes gracilis TaxID=150966 RepID=A0AAD3SRH7_NEPGR|nr:hypothetical protein Nepgr_018511 [Nepenthes gracilis]